MLGRSKHKAERLEFGARSVHFIIAQLVISIIKACREIQKDNPKEEWINYIDGLYENANTPYEDLSEEKKEALREIVRQIINTTKR